MEFTDVIHYRKSIRSFSSDQINDEQLNIILEAANFAPSAGNLQAYEIYVIGNPAIQARIAHACNDQEFIANAPLVLVFCTNPERNEWRYHARGVNLYTIQDATIACSFAMLAAANLGLGSVWVGAFDTEEVQHLIGCEGKITPVAVLPIGLPTAQPPAKPRRKMEDLVHYVSK